MDLYPWVVVGHVGGAFLFVMAHGVSVFAAFKVRAERDPARIRTLLELSGATLGIMYGGLALLLVAGIAAAVAHGWFGYAWPWIAIVVLAVLAITMFQRGSLYYNQVRHAVGMRAYGDRPDALPPELVAPELLARLLATRRPEELTATGGLGLLVLIWLMVAKPF